MFRTMRELKKLQKERKDEQAANSSCGHCHELNHPHPIRLRSGQAPINGNRDEAATRRDLKNKPNRGRDVLGTRGRDVRDTKQSQKPAFGGKSEARSSKSETGADKDQKCDMKKQSQFATALMDTKACAARAYGERPLTAQLENKANQSGFQEPNSSVRKDVKSKTCPIG